MTTKNDIMAAIESPKLLEQLYQADPVTFTESFDAAYKKNPDSLALQIWFERLHYHAGYDDDIIAKRNTNRRYLLLSILLGITTGVFSILPLIIDTVISDVIYERSIALLILSPLLVYFTIKNLRKPKHIICALTTFIGLPIFINCIPDNDQSITSFLSPIFAPFLLWILIGFTFCADKWKDPSKRNEFLYFSGKLIFLTIIFFIFWIFFLYLIEIFCEYIDLYSYFRRDDEFLIFGLALFPTVSAHLLENDPRFRINFHSFLLRFFIPLVLLIEISFIILVNKTHEKPISIIDSMYSTILIIFVTLIFTILSTSDRPNNSFPTLIDYITLVLVGISLITGIIILVNFLVQTSLSNPSELFIAGVGSYILFLIHLAGIFDLYIEFLRKKGKMQAIQNWTARLMPVYALWLLLIIVGLPIYFDFI